MRIEVKERGFNRKKVVFPLLIRFLTLGPEQTEESDRP